MSDELAGLGEDLAFVATVLDELARSLVRVHRRPMPPAVARARRILDRALNCVTSLERQPIGADRGQSTSEHIGTDEVAERSG